ncbi:tetraspanin-12-like [Dendroctonus ponderosae]|uniref:Tetraspanin n=1 Tax=Dendroctonus ponderosae TaxID=77166 RepID=U4U2N5_DENPD|nr:tetraspanin-12-like [Dendroctonus ponderosae]ERL86583.1 hypothetical protein D910_03990 [Dendroctonus ponderosae]
MCCSEGLVRACVFVVNFALGLIGIVLLSLGAFYTIQLNQYELGIPEDYETLKFLPIYSMIVGAVAFLISFWGCWGTLKSNTSLLTSYAAILVVLFILQVGLGLFALLHIKNEDDLHQQLEQRLDIAFSKYNQTAEDTAAVISIQTNLECCGTTSPKWWSSVGLEVSPSCYGKSQQADAFGQGCIQALLAFIVRFAKLTAIIALSVSAIDVIGAVVALYLIKCIKARQIRKVYY